MSAANHYNNPPAVDWVFHYGNVRYTTKLESYKNYDEPCTLASGLTAFGLGQLTVILSTNWSEKPLRKVFLLDVLYVPDARVNGISLETLMGTGRIELGPGYLRGFTATGEDMFCGPIHEHLAVANYRDGEEGHDLGLELLVHTTGPGDLHQYLNIIARRLSFQPDSRPYEEAQLDAATRHTVDGQSIKSDRAKLQFMKMMRADGLRVVFDEETSRWLVERA